MADPTEWPEPGSIVTIRAWWADWRSIPCRVESVSKHGVTVRPRKGNPHMRFHSPAGWRRATCDEEADNG